MIPTKVVKKPPVILLTGASSGLGLAIAKELSKRRCHLVLTARQTSLSRFQDEGIEENETCWIRSLDVLEDSERRSVVGEINERLGGVDVLINNAGFSYRAVMEHVESSDVLMQMGTNFSAPLELIRLSLPLMRAKRFGKIINVSSVGGMMAMPTMGIYSASKFALEGATEALFYELRPWGIHVTLVEPGFIRSEAFKNVRLTKLGDGACQNPLAPYYGHYHFMAQFIERVMNHAPGNTMRVARKIVKLLDTKRPPLRVLATPDACLFDIMRRTLPRAFYHWLLYSGLPHAPCWGDEARMKRRCAVELQKFEEAMKERNV